MWEQLQQILIYVVTFGAGWLTEWIRRQVKRPGGWNRPGG